MDVIGFGIVAIVGIVAINALMKGGLNLGPGLGLGLAPPSKGGKGATYGYAGDSWNSSAWAGKPDTVITNRSKKIEWVDGGDKRVCIVAVGDGGYKTNGDGTFDVTGSSPRISIEGNWQNVESTIYLINGKGTIDMRPKTDHYCYSKSKFGGYIINFNFAENKIYLRSEETHATGYSTRKNVKTFKFPKGNWIGLRGVCYNLGKGVKLEAWVDTGSGFQKITEGIDTGDWKGKPYTAACGASAIRSEGGNKYKNWTVREISVAGAKSEPEPIPKQSAIAYHQYPHFYRHPQDGTGFLPISLSS